MGRRRGFAPDPYANVVACRTYYYDIVAVDQCGNESASQPSSAAGKVRSRPRPTSDPPHPLDRWAPGQQQSRALAGAGYQVLRLAGCNRIRRRRGAGEENEARQDKEGRAWPRRNGKDSPARSPVHYTSAGTGHRKEEITDPVTTTPKPEDPPAPAQATGGELSLARILKDSPHREKDAASRKLPDSGTLWIRPAIPPWHRGTMEVNWWWNLRLFRETV